jgi:hypothetical protein
LSSLGSLSRLGRLGQPEQTYAPGILSLPILTNPKEGIPHAVEADLGNSPLGEGSNPSYQLRAEAEHLIDHKLETAVADSGPIGGVISIQTG